MWLVLLLILLGLNPAFQKEKEKSEFCVGSFFLIGVQQWQMVPDPQTVLCSALSASFLIPFQKGICMIYFSISAAEIYLFSSGFFIFNFWGGFGGEFQKVFGISDIR